MTVMSQSFIEANDEYLVVNYQDSQKAKIYDLLTKYRFPSILNKANRDEFRIRYTKLNLQDTFRSKETERKFIKNEINKIAPGTQVLTIPKTLYQFGTYDYLVNLKRPDKYEEYFSPEDHLRNENWAITKACGYVMEQPQVKDLFWKVNDYVSNLYQENGYNIEYCAEHILNAFKCRNSILDSASKSRQGSSVLVLSGTDCDGNPVPGWTEGKRKKLVNRVVNYITSENSASEYVICRGGGCKLIPEIAHTLTVCYSDGLGSGLAYDEGASAFVISGASKLWYLKLDRLKLLNGLYPIFIPPAQHLLSACGRGETFHIRSKVIQGVISGYLGDKILEDELGIYHDKKVPVCGFHLWQTPEYFTTLRPQLLLLKYNKKLEKWKYTITKMGIFDRKGAEAIKSLCQETKLVPRDGIF